MTNKIFAKVFILLLLILICFPNDSLAKKKKAKKSYNKNTPITKVGYKTRHTRHIRARKVFVPVNGILFQTLKGDVLLEQNSEQYFNPASVMKIATSLTALEQLGYNYRFNTDIYITGKLDPEGNLQGDLIIAGGGDPAIFSENIFLIVDSLSSLGIKTIIGDLIITAPFYLNFDYSPQRSALQIKSIFSGNHWTKPLEEAWLQYTQKQPDRIFSGLEILGQARAISSENLPEEKQLLLTYQSRTLVDILKIQNDYSSNFMAEVIGRHIGGTQAIKNFLVEKVGIEPDDVRVSSASGLGENRITPNAALRLLRSFYESANRHGRRLDDLLPAAGVDEGTLDERFTESDLRGSVVAKTGTLLRQRVSALVGVAYTKEKGPIFFALLDRDDVTRARRHQDQVVKDMIYQYGGPIQTRSVIDGFETSPKIIIAQPPSTSAK
ncbi:MAG: D-alanyl-D-alanine carboxypeptidase [Acidobacteria bacterium]|nr:D-alanyl-D-alanine carboxypeptidase [Acidobacteriota bacterium]